ncbi:MAG: tRNA (adenosine(37)-N6)-threonylcarbamoyltransferase complex transferase subunit TsaD, partial [Clostridia bacterium]|nr:tRNA (adenosine(37)-N6)-threonylcarbamoyltransferase complex transferase subunit TsaD [Clostridia bacterium]
MILLGIESSCDDTSAALVEDGRKILSIKTLSQIDIHKVYGGVVPEIASRKHLETVAGLAEEAVTEAGISRKEIGAVAATNRPGLIGALLTGFSYAKGASYSLGVPLVAVNHIAGHVAAAYLAFPELAPPFTALSVSGGNTLFIRVTDYADMRVLGSTRDDAAGEAFDKIARVMGIPYPGGAEIDRLARI